MNFDDRAADAMKAIVQEMRIAFAQGRDARFTLGMLGIAGVDVFKALSDSHDRMRSEADRLQSENARLRALLERARDFAEDDGRMKLARDIAAELGKGEAEQ